MSGNMLRAKKRRDSKAETGKENISSMDEHAFQKTFRENVDELPMEQVKINENLVAHVTAICTGDFPKTVIESTSNEPNNFCTCRNRAGGSNKLNVLEKFEKLKKVSPASFPCYLRFQHANRNKANNREPRNSYDLEEHERIARVLWEKLEQNWDGRVRKHKSKKRARKVKRSRAREANHPRDPVICLENLTDTLRTAVQITENYKTEEPDPMRGHKSSTEKCLSSKGAVRAACRKVHRKKHSKFGVKKSWLPKELQDHTYAAPPPKHSQKSYKGSGRMTEKKKKIKDPHLKKELAKRRLFIGGFAPCHFLTHGLSGPVEKQDPKSLEDLLKQIFRVEKKSS